jgi:hypothetical protein
MIDDDIRKLAQQQSHRSLAGLEVDIWAGVEACARERRFSRVVYSCQAAVMAVVLLTSIAAGTHVASAQNQLSALNVFSTRADLAPSYRLIGH